MEMNPTVWRKLKNQVIQKWWIYYEWKSTFKRFGFCKPSSGLWDSEISVDWTMMDIYLKVY